MKNSTVTFFIVAAFALGACFALDYGKHGLALYSALLSIRFALVEAVERMKED